ncbi:MAG: Asp-tRNA(Asn)/Glu-tRNA(Gln) amidotransferase subunit GatA [Halobacteriaceae archaeon]
MSHDAFITDTHIEGVDDGPLAGVTVAVKDNLSTAGVRTTCGSKMLADYEPPYNATVVDRVLDAGATIVGKTNMDEFGMGGTTETSAFGPTTNPVDQTRVPGGSSGGSAAAVAAGDADVALGTDTGGSVRNPAAFCGVVGIKPTYGLVSRYGLIAYANSLEQVGPIADNVADAATLLDVIAGPDDRDATTQYEDDAGHHPAETAEYVGAVGDPVANLTVGVITDLLDGAEDRVVQTFQEALETLRAEGVDTIDVSLESLDHALAAYYVIAMSEASSNLARYDGVRYGVTGGDGGDWNEAFARAREAGFGDEVKRRILLGTYALSAGYHEAYYEKAQDARAWVKQDFDTALEEADLLATPTMPIVAPELGERIEDPMQLYLMDANTVPVNLANLPAISVPAGRADGLPVGLQLIGPAFGEETLIRAASVLE